jgi:hypothetical protein
LYQKRKIKVIDKELGQSNQCLESSFNDLQHEFSGLDFDYMLNRKYGELYCDLGVSFNPINEEPIVGLWKLDALEASFGAAGFLQGTIHKLNTLDRYGGLQAEMSAPRSQRTHIVFGSAYNLAYEVTRRLDNGRVLFKEDDAYNFHSNYQWDIETVLELYDNVASKNSYGVRWEIRVGGQALLSLLNGGLDDTVSNLHDLKGNILIFARLTT